ncbi:hypothetical protein [Dyadobacter sp. Leaf189]|uniref:hypothetical protein n=1 Tax=Dyadobacter sp. Leaf189 TaxID=1736295 RepID=UPI0006FF7BF4|nr:hypothetical protein [Dyadobacter sp. Leaf189]KQS30768.1 hypothetical protein ASG33_10315 [Dyadobacter sp. Leaf189]
MNAQEKENEKDIEGSSPSRPGPKGEAKHEDDSAKPQKTLKKEAIKESEEENMTGKKGYNETPPTVPVK